MSAHAENSIHDEVFLLLPWYVNGTLDSSQKSLIEEHVRGCIVCRRELPAEYRTLDVFRNESPLDQSVQAGFERLHDRIAARTPSRLQSKPTKPANPIWSGVVNKLRSFAAAGLRPAMVAAALAVVAMGFVLTQLGEQQQPGSGYDKSATATDGYHTLSSPVAAAANPDDAHVIFARYTRNETIEGVLKAVPARIVAGPDNTGVYTVRLENVSGENERRTAIEKLRNQPHVIFAEAAQPLSVSNQKAQSQ